MKSSYKPIGNYIQIVDNRNVNLDVKKLLGINITKNFMPSVANVSKTDYRFLFDKYRHLYKNFAPRKTQLAARLKVA